MVKANCVAVLDIIQKNGIEENEIRNLISLPALIPINKSISSLSIYLIHTLPIRSSAFYAVAGRQNG